MSKQTHAALVPELFSFMDQQDIKIYQHIVGYLLELGYTPQKQKVKGYALSFKNNEVNQTIAKIGVSGTDNKRVFFRIKFYACRNPPRKFIDAVQKASE